jgi:hypothetical protein
MAVVKHATLVAATVTTVSTLADGYQRVEVTNVDGAAAVYFTIDGTTPTVAGDDCHVLPASISSMSVKDSSPGAAPTVKLISSGTPKVSVRVHND